MTILIRLAVHFLPYFIDIYFCRLVKRTVRFIVDRERVYSVCRPSADMRFIALESTFGNVVLIQNRDCSILSRRSISA